MSMHDPPHDSANSTTEDPRAAGEAPSAPAVPTAPRAQPGRRRALVIGGAIAGVATLAIAGFAAYGLLVHGFALDPRQVPTSSTGLTSETIGEDVLEQEPELRRIERSLELGAFGCSVSSSMLTSLRDADDAADMHAFLDENARAATAKKLRCALQMADAFTTSRATGMQLETEDGKERHVLVLDGKEAALPNELRTKAASLAGSKAYCLLPDLESSDAKAEDQATPVDKAKEPKTDPCDSSEATFAAHHSDRWLFGPRSALETVLRSMQTPAADVSTSVGALVDGLTSVPGHYALRRASRIPENELTSKLLVGVLLNAPCSMAHVECPDFMPKKPVEALASRARVVAFGKTSPHGTKRFAYTVNFVARDEEQAKAIEGDLKEAFHVFRDKVADNETKLRNQAKKEEGKKDAATRVAPALIDAFVAAVRDGKVSRSGRIASLTLDHAIGDAQSKEIVESLTAERTDPRRKAALAILQSVADRRPPPESAVETLLGKDMAAFALAPRVALEKEACEKLEKHIDDVTESPDGWRWTNFCYGAVSIPKCVVDASDEKGVLACVKTPNAAERVDVGGAECKEANTKLEKARDALKTAIVPALVACKRDDRTLQRRYFDCLEGAKDMLTLASCKPMEKPSKACKCESSDPLCTCAKNPTSTAKHDADE